MPQPNKRLQRTGISGSLIEGLPHDAVAGRPLKHINIGFFLTMETNLHSLETYLYKYLLPICFIPWDGFRSARASFPPNDQNGQAMLWLFIGVWFVMTPFVFWYGFKIKRVFIDDRVIRVKGYLKEIEIPLDNVESVCEGGLARMRHLTLRLREPTSFGDRIWFMPKRRIETTSGKKTPLEELRKRIYQPNKIAS